MRINQEKLNNQIRLIAFLIGACLVFLGWIAGLYTAQYCFNH
jgi:hypothetical protein